MLLCVRFKGRRIHTINPAVADHIFCLSKVRPVSSPLPITTAETSLMTVEDCLNLRPIPPNDHKAPIILTIHGLPRLQYAVLYWYRDVCTTRIASNCIETAVIAARGEAKGRKHGSYMVITGNDVPGSKADQVATAITQKYR